MSWFIWTVVFLLQYQLYLQTRVEQGSSTVVYDGEDKFITKCINAKKEEIFLWSLGYGIKIHVVNIAVNTFFFFKGMIIIGRILIICILEQDDLVVCKLSACF